MKTEERRAKDREWYQANRERVLAKNRARYKKMGKRKKAALNEKKRQWDREHREERLAKNRAKYCTEEYRAERRRKYAEKHKDNPMTEHRKRCIEAAKERMTMTLEERKAKRIAKRAEEAARKDIQKTYGQGEEESIRKRETVIKYIDKWTKRKIFATTTEKNGEFMSEADVRAYYQESLKYFRLQAQLEATDQTDYSTRNVLSYKMRVIEDHFNTLLNKRINTRSKIKNEL